HERNCQQLRIPAFPMSPSANAAFETLYAAILHVWDFLRASESLRPGLRVLPPIRQCRPADIGTCHPKRKTPNLSAALGEHCSFNHRRFTPSDTSKSSASATYPACRKFPPRVRRQDIRRRPVIGPDVQ